MSKRTAVLTLAEVAILIMLAGHTSAGAFPLNGDASSAQLSAERVKPKVYHASDKGVKPPKVIFNPEPSEAKTQRAGIPNQMVRLEVVVGVAGDVTDIKIIQGFDKLLTTKAVEAVKTWKFKPAMRYGIAVPCMIGVEVSFWLK